MNSHVEKRLKGLGNKVRRYAVALQSAIAVDAETKRRMSSVNYMPVTIAESKWSELIQRLQIIQKTADDGELAYFCFTTTYAFPPLCDSRIQPGKYTVDAEQDIEFAEARLCRDQLVAAGRHLFDFYRNNIQELRSYGGNAETSFIDTPWHTHPGPTNNPRASHRMGLDSGPILEEAEFMSKENAASMAAMFGGSRAPSSEDVEIAVSESISPDPWHMTRYTNPETGAWIEVCDFCMNTNPCCHEVDWDGYKKGNPPSAYTIVDKFKELDICIPAHFDYVTKTLRRPIAGLPKCR